MNDLNWICTKCGLRKPLADFMTDRSRPSGHKQPCKSCCKEAARRWHARNPEKVKAKYRRRVERGIYQKVVRHLRSEVIEAYGSKCACCGETETKFLVIDHIFNDGAQHRRDHKLTAGYKFYAWLKRWGFPKDRFQLLCWNCNIAKGRFGECPHIKANAHPG